MSFSQKARTLTPVGLALGAFALVAAPVLPLASEAFAASGQPEEETTISVRQKGDSAPTVVKIPDLRVGEVRTIVSESDKAVTVTRTETGYTLNVGGKDVEVRTDLCDGGEAMKVVVGSGNAHAYAFKTHGPSGTWTEKASEQADGKKCEVRKVMFLGDGASLPRMPRPDAKAILDTHSLAALEGVDARTRETVTRALDELLSKGVVAPPMHRVMIVDGNEPASDETGDRVEVRVEKKIRIEKN